MLYIAYAECENTAADRHNTAHNLLNSMLSSAGINARVEKAYGGKPYIEGDKAFVSLSHSESAVCCALSCEEKISSPAFENLITREDEKAPVGVDLEKIVPDRDFEKIARGFFSNDEQSYAEGDVNRFYHVYTRKESLSKATGGGIAELRRQPSVLSRIGTYTYNIKLPSGDYVLSVSLL
jgi:phosphopantetheinyl transferase